MLEAGGVPTLAELRLHNGTVYRWNRPVYDVVGDLPHLRVENRVLPAGPTVADTLANAALYYGLVRVLAEDDRPVWTRMSFAAAEENFHNGARHGIEARTFWPGLGEVPTTELVLRRLLPMAADGLSRWGVDASVSDRLLGILEQRCLTHRNGAEWQVETVRMLEAEQNLSRAGRAAPDGPELRRAHAQQRAGAHLAGRLSPVRAAGPPGRTSWSRWRR